MQALPGPFRPLLSQRRHTCRSASFAAPAPQRPGKRRACSALRAAKVADMLAEAKKKYAAGDRMSALRLYEGVLQQVPEPSLEERQAAYFGATAVHAAFGDAELAQMTLRDGINLGLDFEAALVDPAQVEFVTSPQLIIQLKRFNTAVKKALAVKAAAPPAAGGAAAGMGGAPLGGAAGAAARGRGRGAPLDLDSIMGSSSSDKADVDTSIPGIIKRVALVLVTGVALGVGLYFLGLEYMFPKV